MKKFLILFLVTGLVACSDDSDNNSSSGAPTGAATDTLVRGEGLDVGNDAESKFTETGTEPQAAEACAQAGEEIQFDPRVLPGSQWEYQSEVQRPGLSSQQSLQSSVAGMVDDVLNLENTMSFKYAKSAIGEESTTPGETPAPGETPTTEAGMEDLNFSFNTVTNIAGGSPQTTVDPANEEVQANLDLIEGLSESNCEFTAAQVEETNTRHGNFRLDNGSEVPATYTIEMARGSWVCRDEQGQVVLQEENVSQQMDTVTSYAIPSVMAEEQCKLIPIYSYMRVFSSETQDQVQVFESSRNEISNYVAGQEAPAVEDIPVSENAGFEEM